jgi:hypothetical protein
VQDSLQVVYFLLLPVSLFHLFGYGTVSGRAMWRCLLNGRRDGSGREAGGRRETAQADIASFARVWREEEKGRNRELDISRPERVGSVSSRERDILALTSS